MKKGIVLYMICCCWLTLNAQQYPKLDTNGYARSVNILSLNTPGRYDNLPTMHFTDISRDSFNSYTQMSGYSLIPDTSHYVYLEPDKVNGAVGFYVDHRFVTYTDSSFILQTAVCTHEFKLLPADSLSYPRGIRFAEHIGYVPAIHFYSVNSCESGEWLYCSIDLIDSLNNILYTVGTDFEYGVGGPYVSPDGDKMVLTENNSFEEESANIWILKKQMEDGLPVFREVACAVAGDRGLDLLYQKTPSIWINGQIDDVIWVDDQTIAVRVKVSTYDITIGKSRYTYGYYLGKVPKL